MSVELQEGFWKQKTDMVAQKMIPYQWDALSDAIPGAEQSHALENFRIAAGELSGDYKGTIFQDSDVAKWIEAACYSLMSHPDPVVEAHVEEAVRLIQKTQDPDGYINTHSKIAAPDKRWSDIPWGHELYCAGHLIEAGVAHYRATGKKYFLDTVCRYASYINSVFGPEEGKKHTAGGHPEIELALFKLYETTGTKQYRNLALYFIDVRGTNHTYFNERNPQWFRLTVDRWFDLDYFQMNKPVRRQRDATGHAVRAMYLYSAMADAYRETKDAALLEALHALWESTVNRRMYITGGIGSQGHAERFTVDYDLPPDTAYAETCASIGLVFWAERMLRIEGKRTYADVIERELYNGMLSGVSLDGKKYFYVNPLEMTRSVAEFRFDHHYVKTERVPWLGVACCPPNLARLIASVDSYIYRMERDAEGQEVVCIDQYISSIIPDTDGIGIALKSGFPWNGNVTVTVAAAAPKYLTLKCRIPSWCTSYTAAVGGKTVADAPGNDGYIMLSREWSGTTEVTLSFAMAVQFIRSNMNVAENAGKVALQRGPVVYCFEEADNGPALHQIVVDTDAPVKTEAGTIGGEQTVFITLHGFREQSLSDGLYSAEKPEQKPVQLTAIPYYQWGNRQPGNEMRVWIRN